MPTSSGMRMARRRGVVRDEANVPVEGALVVVEWGTAPTPEIAVETDAAGMFHLALPQEGRYRIRARAPDGSSGSSEVRGDSDEEIAIALGAEGRPR